MKDSLVGVYTYRSGNMDSAHNGFYFLYLLDDSGLMDLTSVIELYEETFTASKCPIHEVGPFETIESLNQFAYKICDQFNYSKISLHSTTEYNSIMESVSGLSELKTSLFDSGNIIENVDHKQKKGLIGRLFS